MKFYYEEISKEELFKMVESGKLEYHHSALARGYHTNKGVSIYPYEGKFGKGYVMHANDPKTNRYHNISYYIFKEA